MATRYQLTRGAEGEITLRNKVAGAGGMGDGMAVKVWGGWEWTHDGRRYRTDREGCGLWVWLGGKGEWSQSSGTSQFSLSKSRVSALRALKREDLTPDTYEVAGDAAEAVNVRLTDGASERLRQIAVEVGAVAPSGGSKGDGSISQLLNQIAAGQLAVTRVQSDTDGHLPNGTYIWRHNTSGERFVVTLVAGHVTDAAGPLHYSEVETVIKDGFDSDAELVEDIDADQDSYALVER